MYEALSNLQELLKQIENKIYDLDQINNLSEKYKAANTIRDNDIQSALKNLNTLPDDDSVVRRLKAQLFFLHALLNKKKKHIAY